MNATLWRAIALCVSPASNAVNPLTQVSELRKMLEACLHGLDGKSKTIVDVVIKYSAVAYFPGSKPPTGNDKVFYESGDDRLAVAHDGYSALSLYVCHCGRHTRKESRLQPQRRTCLYPNLKGQDPKTAKTIVQTEGTATMQR